MQLSLHTPQWDGLFARSTQLAAHNAVGAAQGTSQTPWAHTVPAVHLESQLPQCSGFVDRVDAFALTQGKSVGAAARALDAHACIAADAALAAVLRIRGEIPVSRVQGRAVRGIGEAVIVVIVVAGIHRAIAVTVEHRIEGRRSLRRALLCQPDIKVGLARRRIQGALGRGDRAEQGVFDIAVFEAQRDAIDETLDVGVRVSRFQGGGFGQDTAQPHHCAGRGPPPWNGVAGRQCPWGRRANGFRWG